MHKKIIISIFALSAMLVLYYVIFHVIIFNPPIEWKIKFFGKNKLSKELFALNKFKLEKSEDFYMTYSQNEYFGEWKLYLVFSSKEENGVESFGIDYKSKVSRILNRSRAFNASEASNYTYLKD